MKASALRKRRAKLLLRQHRLLHELSGIYGEEYQEVLARCAEAMRRAGMAPDGRLDSALVQLVTES